MHPAPLPQDYRPIVDSAPFGVFRTDARGDCIYTNAAWQAIVGLTLAESLGRGWTAAVHPDERESVLQRWLGDAAAGRAFDMRFRLLRRDGRECAVRSRAWAVATPEQGFFGVVEDITELVAQERRLADSLTLLDRSGQLSQVGGWELDLVSGTVTWSAETCRLHDRPPGWQPSLDEGIGYWAPEAQGLVRAEIERLRNEGGHCDFELPMSTAQGRRIWVRVVGEAELRDGRPVRLFGATQDVTERRSAELELQASRETLRRLYDDTPALLASVDRGGIVRSCTALLLERLGRRRDEVVGFEALRLLHGDEAARAEALAAVERQLRQPGGGSIRGLPLTLAHRDGSAVPTRLSAVVERGPDGLTRRLLAVFVDDSEVLRRRAELARERSLREQVERQAAELHRLADERREMLDLLAHEVRQPLNNASAALQSAASLADARHDPEGRTRLARAQGVIGHVVAQIDNTLAAAALLVGGGSAECVDVDIDTLVQLVLADLPSAQRPRIVLERATPTRTAAMDLGLVRLALRNLLANALRHGPAPTPVVLRIADSDEPLALLIDVEDAGPGVDPALRHRLFERGVRGPRSRGQGLGLYIARRALEQHGGTVELLHSAPGRTVFRLVLAQGGSTAPAD